MVNEEEKILKIFKTFVFVLFMLGFGAIFKPETAVIVLLCLLYMKK